MAFNIETVETVVKKLAAEATTYDPNVIGIYGAMELYLDFINLFLKLLRIMGKRK